MWKVSAVLLTLVICLGAFTSSDAKSPHKKPHHKRMNIVPTQGVVAKNRIEPTSFTLNKASGINVEEETGNKRSILRTLEEEFPASKTQDMIKKFTEVVKKTFPAPSDESEFEQNNGKFMDVLEVASKSSGDLFKQAEDKMGVTPSPTFQNSVRSEKDFVNNLASENDPLNKAKWIKLKELKSKFLPQDQDPKDSKVYSKDFFPDLTTYIVTFVAATVDMIVKGEVEQCQLSRELDILKFDTETAVQALIYRRLGMLEPVGNSWAYVMGNDKINWNDKYKDKKLCDGNGCILKNDNGNPVEDAIKDVGKTVLNDAKQMFDVVDEILKEVATGGEMCFKDCDCPKEEEAQIERVKYNTDFPWGCRGELKRTRNSDEKRECVLPCGTYGQSYEWCPVALSNKNSDWDYCKVADSKQCAVGWY